MKELTLGKKAASCLLSAALVVAFAPAIAAPQAKAASKYTSADKKGAIAYIENWVDKQDKITLNAAKKIVAYFDNELLDRLDDTGDPLDAEIVAMKTWSEDAIKKINTTQQQLNAMVVSNLKASKNIKKTKLTWDLANPKLIKDYTYQYKYRIGKGDYKKPKSFDSMKKNSKGKYYKTVKKLKKNTTYTFKVRIMKQMYGEKIYGKWSNTATVKVLPSYKTGKYKTKENNVRFRKSSNNKPTTRALRFLKKGTKVKFTSFKVRYGYVYGKCKLKVNGKKRTGWIRMDMVKKA